MARRQVICSIIKKRFFGIFGCLGALGVSLYSFITNYNNIVSMISFFICIFTFVDIFWSEMFADDPDRINRAKSIELIEQSDDHMKERAINKINNN